MNEVDPDDQAREHALQKSDWGLQLINGADHIIASVLSVYLRNGNDELFVYQNELSKRYYGERNLANPSSQKQSDSAQSRPGLPALLAPLFQHEPNGTALLKQLVDGLGEGRCWSRRMQVPSSLLLDASGWPVMGMYAWGT